MKSLHDDALSLVVVDDSSTVRKGVELAFQSLGWAVSAFDNSVGVAVKIMASRPDVLFIDLNMPNLMGESLIRILKNKNCIPDSRLYLFSGKEKSELAKKVQELGVEGYLTKDMTYEEMDRIVRRDLKMASLNF